MSYPILKPNSSWFAPTVSTVNRGIITTINIVDSYTPTTTPTDSWDASVAQDGSIMCYVEGTVLTIAGNGSGKIATNANSKCLFSDINKKDYFDVLTSINGLNMLDTSNTTNMSFMFSYCIALLDIDVSGWDTSNVIAFAQMFEAMQYLEEIIGLDDFNTAKGKSFAEMFSGCYALKELNLSSFDTRAANVGTVISGNNSTSTCTKNMFANCRNLEKITIGENFTFAGNGTAAASYHGVLPTPSATYINGADGNWYTEDGATYAVADIPNLTYAVYYASPIVLADSIWDRDSKKYMHLSAMRKYHDMQNAEIDIKIDTLKEELGNIGEISSEEITALFSV